MNLSGNTVLVTGGASGIGLALVERFLAKGNDVIVCGRRASKLSELSEKHPEVNTVVCDIADPVAREKLFKDVTDSFGDMNVLVNNAGIQRRIDLTENEDWD